MDEEGDQALVKKHGVALAVVLDKGLAGLHRVLVNGSVVAILEKGLVVGLRGLHIATRRDTGPENAPNVVDDVRRSGCLTQAAEDSRDVTVCCDVGATNIPNRVGGGAVESQEGCCCHGNAVKLDSLFRSPGRRIAAERAKINIAILKEEVVQGARGGNPLDEGGPLRQRQEAALPEGEQHVAKRWDEVKATRKSVLTKGFIEARQNGRTVRFEARSDFG
jgi:hypothetical protein